MDDPRLVEQIRYYRARAAEYDEWFYRQGRYDHGAALNARWHAEAAAVRQALHDLAPTPLASALELACGTGIWTQELLKVADRVTVIDASPEMLAIHRAKLASERVTYRQEDLFQWQPGGQYDLVFFGFWLSHVPPERLADFLGKVAASLKPGGRAFMVDSRREPSATAQDMTLPADQEIMAKRTLKDGQTYRVIKIFYAPEDLAAHFARAGLDPTVALTPNYFIYASAARR